MIDSSNIGKYIESHNIGSGWIHALENLRNSGDEIYGLVVNISHPEVEIPEVREDLDDLLRRLGLQSVQTVANTIFPQSLYDRTNNCNELFRRYKRIYPRLRKNPKNRTGTYFGRLISWAGNGQETNQIKRIIEKLNSRPKDYKSRYPALVYDPQIDQSIGTVYLPIRDQNKVYGFPCLSFIDFKFDPPNNKLHLIAFYRNHLFIERAYGNYLGLAMLLGFVCRETKLEIGNLIVISSHAEIERNKREIDTLIKKHGGMTHGIQD